MNPQNVSAEDRSKAGKRQQLADLLGRGPGQARTYPLSYAQQRLWFLDQLNPGNPFYSISHAVKLDFPIDPAVLTSALNEIVSRHDALRTMFRSVDGRPVQIVAPALTLQVPLTDLRHLGETADARASEIATAEARIPFELSKGPLLRTRLIRTAQARYVLALTIHHIICDGWSMEVLFQELATLYEAFATGKPSPLAPLTIQYPDYAAWERSRSSHERTEGLMGYWVEQLKDLPVLALPTDHNRPPVQSFAGRTRQFTLPVDLMKDLRALASESESTLFMVLLTGFAALLGRYSGQSDLPIGVPVAGRTRSELEPLIGFFVNTLVMRVDLSGDPSFRDAISRVRAMALEAYAHQDVPFDRLVEDLAPARDPSRNPLVQVAFQLFGDHSGARTRPETATSGQFLPIERGTAVFDLVVTTWEMPDGTLHGKVESSDDLFDEATVARLLQHWQVLLAAAVANSDAPLSRCSLLTDDDKAALQRWNETAAPHPDQGLTEVFATSAATWPDATALVSGDEKVSYADLDRRATALAHDLVARGVGPESIVGLCLPRSVQMVVALLAILKAGGAYLPLDPTYPADRLSAMLQDAQPVLVVTRSELAGGLTDPGIPRLEMDHAISNPPATRLPNPDAHRLAHLIFTSGSTGRPKGTLLEGRGIGNLVLEQRRHFGVGPGDRVLQFASLSYDAATFEIAMALGTGAALCIGSPDDLTPGAPLAAFIQSNSVSVVTLPPSILATLNPDELANLRVVTVAGEAFPARLASLWAQGRKVFNLYGPTEATIWATVAPCDGEGAPPIGWPIANVTCDVVDPAGQQVPVGVAGELWLGGIGIARGYLNRPDLTAERFAPDPFRPGGGTLYHTGDLVRRRADGALDFLGRIDAQVKIRGIRVELGEIEALLEAEPMVHQAVVVVDKTSQGAATMVACIVPAWGGAGDYRGDQVDRWRQLSDETYAGATPATDTRLQTVGWVNSFTGQPIPEAQMQQWVDATVDRLQQLQPRRVLEIGCGTGLILFRLAPTCAHYLATDLSDEAIAYVRRNLDADLARKVDLVTCAAHEIGEHCDLGDYDLIVLNSVVQYFPSVDYLRDVLREAAAHLAPDGVIFLGDVRDLRLLEPLALAIETARADGPVTKAALQQRVQRRLNDETELALDPTFFEALVGDIEGIGDVRVEVKRGRYDNELSRYRADVSLYRHPLPQVETAVTAAETLDALAAQLATTAADAVLVKGIANRRTIEAVRGVPALQGDPAAPFQMPPVPQGIEPEDIHDLATATGWRVDIQASLRPDQFDARFTRGKAPRQASWPMAEPRTPARDWANYGNDPLRAARHRQLVSHLRDKLTRQLPESMVPNCFAVLDKMPLTPNGKVDRRALARRDRVADMRSAAFVAPQSPLEQHIASIWAAMLGVESIGAHDDFFEFGGHSLLATQVVARVRAAFDIDIALRTVFQHRTVAGFATEVERLINERIAQMSEQDAEWLLRKEALLSDEQSIQTFAR